jgi:DNA-binding transcriptional regulator YiaG
MGRTVVEQMAQMSPERRAKIERRAAELISEELSLRELRRAHGKTQSAVASRLKVGQDTVARYEQRSDMLLSTLDRYLKAFGGRLSLLAEFPGRAPVRLKGIGDLGAMTGTVTAARRSGSGVRVAAARRPAPAAGMRRR